MRNSLDDTDLEPRSKGLSKFQIIFCCILDKVKVCFLLHFLPLIVKNHTRNHYRHSQHEREGHDLKKALGKNIVVSMYIDTILWSAVGARTGNNSFILEEFFPYILLCLQLEICAEDKSWLKVCIVLRGRDENSE